VTAALTIPQWILLLTVPSVVIGIFGYRWIHWAMQATAVVVGVSLIMMFIQGLRPSALPPREITLAPPAAGLFLAGVALLVTDMLSFGPFVDVLVIFIPWSAVNLADYFVVRRGSNDVVSFFTLRRRLRPVRLTRALAYAIGLVAQWPFVSQPRLFCLCLCSSA
jgi:nucleobase:cation symporter-1, NCS1 family